MPAERLGCGGARERGVGRGAERDGGRDGGAVSAAAEARTFVVEVAALAASGGVAKVAEAVGARTVAHPSSEHGALRDADSRNGDNGAGVGDGADDGKAQMEQNEEMLALALFLCWGSIHLGHVASSELGLSLGSS